MNLDNMVERSCHKRLQRTILKPYFAIQRAAYSRLWCVYSVLLLTSRCYVQTNEIQLAGTFTETSSLDVKRKQNPRKLLTISLYFIKSREHTAPSSVLD